jgi:hypothetical protein
MATRLYVSFNDNAALATAFGSTEAAIAAVDAAWDAFSATHRTSEEAAQSAYDAATAAAQAAGLAAWFAESGDGFGRITTRAYDYAVAQGICKADDYCGGTSDRAAMRELVTLQLDYAVSYENRGWCDEAAAYREAAATVLRAIDAGLVKSLSFG